MSVSKGAITLPFDIHKLANTFVVTLRIRPGRKEDVTCNISHRVDSVKKKPLMH